jgi:hypothetical protein
MHYKLAAIAILLVATTTAFALKKDVDSPKKIPQRAEQEFNFIRGHQSYDQIIETMKEWERIAPDLVEVGTYGKTSSGKEQYYIKVSNEKNPSEKKVLITAAIHGNEPWSTSVVMAYAGKLISSYGRDEAITTLVDSRTVYIVPVVSPDSYPSSRNVGGKDPNRDFPTFKSPDKESVTPVMNLRVFFLSIKPDSVLSGHTFGRLFLIPWGDSTKENPKSEQYRRIASEMCEMSGYKYQRVCEMYGKPIYGTETDWYARNGAFAMVVEFGTHQKKASEEEVRQEFNKTFGAAAHFIRHSIVDNY